MLTFSEAGLKPEILRAVEELGFTEPTPVQAQTLPLLLEKSTDMLALAQTGTGKTAAFGLPMLQNIQASTNTPQALILSPTRELCMQITRDLESFSKYMKGISITAVYGGSSIQTQIKQLRDGTSVVVATPGRLCDLLDRKAIKLNDIQIVILDEADEMLSMGFKDDLDKILKTTPAEKNTWLFSATMPPEISNIANKFMSNPESISVGKKNSGADNIEHIYHLVNASSRYDALKRVVDFYPEIYGMIFCRTKLETQEVADKLIRDGYSADSLHGDLSQAQRDSVMKKYRSKAIQILVATDVAARGIDVTNITHVIHFNLPDDIESYTHRSGRTARAGRSGMSVSIITKKDMGKISQIERKIGKKMEYKKIPGAFEVCEQQLIHLSNSAHDVEVNPDILPYMPSMIKKFEDISKEDLIQRFLSVEFNRFLDYYKNAAELNIDPSGARSSSGRPDGVEMVRYFANIGEIDGLDKSAMVRLICDTSGLSNSQVGKIELHRSFSFFEVPTQFSSVVEKKFEGATLGDRPVNIEVSESRPPRGRGERSGDRGGDRGGFRRESKFGSEKRFGDKKFGDKKFGDKKFGDKKFGEKRFGKSSGDSSRSGGASREVGFKAMEKSSSDKPKRTRKLW
jgi:ATP-dependent RNA helicase DeaD